jgi:DNA helicase-2/ATP-dependent DNA helicase PcrA
VTLSPAQRRAVEHRGRPLQVIACAGSGKTTTMAARVAGLLAEGVDPAAIVAFTFTERAAAELKARIRDHATAALGAAFRDRLGPLYVGTIHGYCFRLLQEHVPRYGDYDVLDENRHAAFLSREYKTLGLAQFGRGHWDGIRQFVRALDVLGNELIAPSALAGTPLGEALATYEATLDRFRFLTYATLVTRAVAALEDPTTFARVHAPLRHLLVDEYQDVNPAQERLIELLSRPPVELCVVGDDDQSVYQWRGSDVRNILTFARRRKRVATERLEENRRSRPGLIAAANTFAAAIPERLPKEMRPLRAPGSAEVVTWSAASDQSEAEAIADQVEALHAQGFRYRDLAVLYRSAKTSAPPLLEVFRERGVPFSCAGRSGLFLHPEVNLLGETFAWLAGGKWKDDRYGDWREADLDHVVAGLAACFGVAARARKELRTYLEHWKLQLDRKTKPISLVADYYQLLERLGVAGWPLATPADVARWGVLARFSEVLADFEHVRRRGRPHDEDGTPVFRAGEDRGVWFLRGLNNYLMNWAQGAYEDFAGEPTLDLDAVDVLTIHQAKGLEWPVVFLPSLVAGRFPSRYVGRDDGSLLPESVFPPAARARYAGSDAEERRLFYVAMTRARDALYLSCFERKTNRFRPSPYLLEVAGGGLLAPDAPLPLPDPPTAAGPADAAPLDVSFSELARFAECGHSYRLGARLGFQQPLAVELGYGKAVHHVLRQLAETVRETGAVPTAKVARRLVEDAFYVPFASRPASEQMREGAARLVATYLSQHAADLRRVWAVERPFALHFDEGVVSGRADVILSEDPIAEGGKAGRLAIVDYKVAHDAHRDERYHTQLAVYAAAGRGEGLTVEAAYLHELKDGARHPVDVSPKAVTATKKKVRGLLGALKTGVFRPAADRGRCNDCDYRRICGSGPRAGAKG